MHRRKIRYIPFYSFIAFVIYITLLAKISGDSDYTKVLENKRLNDITQLNSIHANRIIKPTTIEEIRGGIANTTGPISIGGGKFSMGGQTAFENSLHFDMRSFNKVLELDTTKKTITIQPGITWRDIQEQIDPYDLSIKIMQTYANFTVGGSISVNCHGRYIGHGPIISSVLGIKLVTASGEMIVANREENRDIFNAVIGGYGGIGVIVEVTLQLADNVKVERKFNKIRIEEYNEFFSQHIKKNKAVVFQNGDLYPPNYDEVINISWHETDKELTESDRIRPNDENYWLEHQMIEVVSWGKGGKWIRRNVVDPIMYNTQKVVWRNNEASYNVQELEPASREKETYVLQEYFIPVNNIESFVPKMRDIYQKHHVNVINVSLRHALPDNEAYLSWANQEVFAFVIYYQQKTDADAKEKVKLWTVEMTDAILSENGSWYLPYQPHASIEQFNQGFPNAPKYFEIKNRLDSAHRFTNKLLDKYNPYLKDRITKKRNTVDGYFRSEEQTILTVPEWYLVFNPKEYADYLQAGKDPSDFPFYPSIQEYWSLYDRSMTLVSEAYPENEEYKTMLQIIGVSVTLEYGVKILYENTVGQLFSLFAEDIQSAEEQQIAAAQRAYSDFIYHTAWYKFEFLPWVGKVWEGSPSSDGSFLRQWERTLLFTLEFSFKAFYAQLLEWAASATYEPPVEDIFMLVTTNDTIPETKDMSVILEQDTSKVLGLTRWGAFTETLKSMSAYDIDINEISGNDEIVVSLIMQKNQSLNEPGSELLYTSRIVTDDSSQRNVYLVDVSQLIPLLRSAQASEMIIEHIYDY
jgi:FAD/FMN-containing dehydrogenase